MVLMFGVFSSFGVFFNPMLDDLLWTRAVTSGAFSLSWIMQGLAAIFVGRVNDRLGPRIVITVCGVILGLGCLLMSQVSTIWQLYLFYGVVVGIGMSGSFVPLMSTVARWFVKRRSMMTGIVLTGMSAGILIASPVAIRLISAFGWRLSYIVLGSIALVALVLVAQLLRRDPAQVKQRPYGENEGGKQEFVSETRSLSLRESVHTRQFWLVSGMFFCFGFCVFSIMVHIVPHAIDLGIPSISAANILATIGGLSILGRIGLGSAADRIGNRQAFIIGFILMSAALFWLTSGKELWGLYLFAIIFGFAFGGCGASESPLVAGLFGLKSHGLILGVITFGFCTGAAVGPFLAGYIFDVRNSYSVAFLICAAISVIGLILTLLLTPLKKAEP
jgi:MFS family permease